MSATSKVFFVDLQGFIESKKFILKELCILECKNNLSSSVNDCVDDKIHHHIFKPPFNWKHLSAKARTQALWLKCFHHGFSWNAGETEYSQIAKIFHTILSKELTLPTVYVKGAEKVEWINCLTNGEFNCINLEQVGCTQNVKELKQGSSFNNSFHCCKHDISLHCASQNVNSFHNWYISQH